MATPQPHTSASTESMVKSATPILPQLPKIEDLIPSFNLENHVTLITGGSGGLAHTLAQALILQGSSIALMDLNQEGLKNLKKELEHFIKHYHDKIPNADKIVISIWQCDVSDPKHVDEVINAIPQKHNGVIPMKLVHTAGYCENLKAEQYDPIRFQKLVNVNLNGSFYIVQSLTNLHLKTKEAILNNNVSSLALPNFNMKLSYVLIASMSGLIVNHPQPQSAYNASKSGVIHLCKSLACEWAKYGIKINCISPGYIATELTKKVISQSVEGLELMREWTSRVPLERMAEPKEFIGSVLYLLSDNASSYTTGENMVVDGGYTCW